MRRGVTMIELILVVGLVTLVVGISGGFYSRFLTQNAVANTTDQLVESLRKAQTYAMAGKENSNWVVAYQGGAIVFYRGNSYATRVSAFDEVTSVNSSLTVSGLTDINFARVTGLPTVIPSCPLCPPEF